MPRRTSARQLAKNERTKAKMLRAALKVVGRVGYAKASIAKIAERAGVSTGTFYLLFKSKEDLYEQLLPWANTEITKFIQDRVPDYNCYMGFEEANIRGFFEYIESTPAFLKVLIEAEVAAPAAWAEYYRRREERYLEIQLAAWDRGEFPDFRREDMPRLCELLTGMRKVSVVRYFTQAKKAGETVDEAIETYLKLTFGALHRTNADQMLSKWGNGATYNILPH